MRLLIPTPEQKNAAQPRQSVWVGANAGSGKTHVLVDRVIRLMLAGADPAAILCLTFTKAAAAEMAARLHERLAGWAALTDAALTEHLQALGEDIGDGAVLVRARRLFTRALETPGGLKIQTIHAFCERLLQLFPVEAGIAPGFRVMDERETKEMYRLAAEAVLHEAETARAGALAEAYATVMRHVTADSFAALMRASLSGRGGLARQLAAADGLDAVRLVLRHRFGFAPGDTTAALEADIISDDPGWASLAAALAGEPEKRLQEALARITAFRTSADAAEKRARLTALVFTADGTPRAGSIITKGFRTTAPGPAAFLDRMQPSLVARLTRHDELLRIEASEALYTLAAAVLSRIKALKAARGAYDFDDLIARTEQLLTTGRLAGWVLYKLDAGLEHILVDEAQDTSPRQWSIVTALAQEFFAGAGRPQPRPRTVFVVGDHKQSIYSFQGADVAGFAAAQARFADMVGAGGQSLSVIDLTISYRSVPAILDVVDQAFAPGSPALTGLERADLPVLSHQSVRRGTPGLFEIWPLMEPLADAQPPAWDAPVDREPPQSPRRRLARRIATMIADWLRRGRLLAAEGRAVVPADILILLQTRRALFSALVAELRRAGVPVAGADRLKLMDNIAILDLLALGQWLLLPDDDHSLACVLKSPLLPEPLDDDALTPLAHGRQGQSLWQRLQDAEGQAARANAAALADWRALGPGVRPYDLYAAVLTARRRAIVARLGSEALDATDAFLDLALAYEEDHGASLAGFLHWFAATDTVIRREMDKSQGEVRLMTVHGAKGLEANIVILPDAADLPGGRGSGLVAIPDGEPGAGLPLWAVPHLVQSSQVENWEQAAEILTLRERNRLLYVAMTRARDELYVCGVAGHTGMPEDCWYAHLKKIFLEDGPGQALMRRVPAFDNDGEIWRHGPDPMWHEAAATPAAALAVPDWATTMPALEGRARSATVTGLAKGQAPADLAAVQRALQRGSAIHLLLQELPDLPASARADYARRKGARLGLAPAEVTELLALMERPDLAVFFSNGAAQSEVSFRALGPDGQALVGQIDRLAVTPSEVLILDYKSDSRPPAAVDASHPYVRQMALYARALAGAWPGHRLRCCLLWTATGRAEWLEEGLLAQALIEMSQAG
jgi:ATP-dependent helicase/nuclease subunit A